MRKILFRTIAATLIVGAGVAYAAVVPYLEDTQPSVQPVTALVTQGLKLETQARQQLTRMIGSEPDSRANTAAAPGADDDTNTSAMLFGALAIMAVMVRRRWGARN